MLLTVYYKIPPTFAPKITCEINEELIGLIFNYVLINETREFCKKKIKNSGSKIKLRYQNYKVHKC